jgi:hypothetical protein
MAGRTRRHRGSDYTVSAAHPAADLFPWLDEDELQQLADDIKANGQKQKVVRHKGRVVDGRNRELACLVAGVRVEYADLPADTPEEKILAGVISANLKRRHLTTSQRAMVAAELETLRHGGDRKSQDAELHLVPARAEIAEQLNVSPRSVANAAKVKNEAPELVEPVKDGKLSVSAAAKVAEYPPEVRQQVAGADDPKEAAHDLLAETDNLPDEADDQEPTDFTPPPSFSSTLPRPSHDASRPVEPHPLYGDKKFKHKARDLKEHRYGDILVAMRNLSRMLTLAMNAPDGVRLKDYLRYLGLVQDRGFILNGKKYNARFRGFNFRHAVKIAVGKGRVKTKEELLRECMEQWDGELDMEEWVPE